METKINGVTVAELIDALKTADQTLVVGVASDAEGNRISPLAGGAWGISLETVEAESSWSWEPVGDEEEPPNVVILWPTN